MSSERPWITRRVPDGFWSQHRNRVDYMDWLGNRLDFTETTDWYRLQNRHFNENRGSTLLQKGYSSSVLNAMRDYLPDEDWKPWLFSRTPAGYWSESRNRRDYLRWLEQRLKIRSPEQWYETDAKDFENNHGAGLIANHYRGSVLAAAREHRPDFDWKPWLFRRVPNGFWRSPENRQCYYRWLAAREGLQTTQDWERLTRQVISQTKGVHLLEDRFRGSMPALRTDAASLLQA